MIEIRHSEGEAELSGTPVEMRDVRQVILDLLSTGNPEVCLPASSKQEAAPYTHVLDLLVIRQEHGPIRVSVSGSSLVVAGAPTNLETFAAWFDFSDEGPTQYHCHYEYYEGNEWIDPKSVPLVLAVERPKVT